MGRLLWAFPIAAFLLNPNLACGPAEPDFEFGAKELRAAVEGNWAVALMSADGSPLQVTVHIEQGSIAVSSRGAGRDYDLIPSARACGNRTLIKGAGACLPETQMPLALTYLAGDPSFAAPGTTLTGTFTVPGTKFEWGMMTLGLGQYALEVDVNADGSIRAARPSQPGLRSVTVTRQ